MKPETELIKVLGEWSVTFTIGNQRFHLYPSDNKEDARQMEKMLQKAFDKMAAK